MFNQADTVSPTNGWVHMTAPRRPVLPGYGVATAVSQVIPFPRRLAQDLRPGPTTPGGDVLAVAALFYRRHGIQPGASRRDYGGFWRLAVELFFDAGGRGPISIAAASDPSGDRRRLPLTDRCMTGT